MPPFCGLASARTGDWEERIVRSACVNCQRPFESSKAAEYCSGRCRAEASRKRKAEFDRGRKRKVRGLLEEAIEVLAEGEESP